MIIQEQYNKLHAAIAKNPQKDYRKKIHDVITLLDRTYTTRTFWYIKKNCDILIETLNQNISIREFMRTQYNTAPYIKSWEKKYSEFLFYMKWLGGKHIIYPLEYIENIWFWFSITHECAHARDYRKDQKNKKELSEEDAIIANEKSARIQWYNIAKAFQDTHNINLLEEFSSIEDVCMYANVHLFLSTYPKYKSHIDIITLTSADFSLNKKAPCITKT